MARNNSSDSKIYQVIKNRYTLEELVKIIKKYDSGLAIKEKHGNE
jgi:hypothetical protein